MTKVLNDKQIIEAVISEVNETYGSCVISQHIMSRSVMLMITTQQIK